MRKGSHYFDLWRAVCGVVRAVFAMMNGLRGPVLAWPG